MSRLRFFLEESAAAIGLFAFCAAVIVICGAMELPAQPDPALLLPARTTAHAAPAPSGLASEPDRMGLFLLSLKERPHE